MSVDYICREVKRLKKKYHESDPFKLCDTMGIILLDAPMGTYPGACKGFFLTQSRKRSITINSDLPEELQRIIVTHELGHAVLHAKADFLMDDDDVLEKLNEDISFFGAAALLRVPPELLDFKFRLMKRNGYKMIDPPLMANSNFLKNVETEVHNEY